MHHFQKHFSIEEARACLPQLRKSFQSIHQHQKVVMELDRKLSEMAAEGQETGGPDVTRLVTELFQMNELLKGILDMGIQIKDIERGLIDFPHLIEDREVFLCWELDEPDIEFWHELDAGYAGRERL